jgi:hypothetical protein
MDFPNIFTFQAFEKSALGTDGAKSLSEKWRQISAPPL